MQGTPWQVYQKTMVQVSMKHRWVEYTQTFSFKWFRETFSKAHVEFSVSDLQKVFAICAVKFLHTWKNIPFNIL